MKSSLRLATRRASAGLLIAAAALALGASGPRSPHLILTGYGTSDRPGPALGATPTSRAVTRTAFRISGNATAFYPGLAEPVMLTVSNPQTYPITLTSITTTVGNASAACPSADLHLTKFTGSKYIAAGHQVTVTVTATMLHTAPNGCQGAKFPLTYAGLGQVP